MILGFNSQWIIFHINIIRLHSIRLNTTRLRGFHTI